MEDNKLAIEYKEFLEFMSALRMAGIKVPSNTAIVYGDISENIKPENYYDSTLCENEFIALKDSTMYKWCASNRSVGAR